MIQTRLDGGLTALYPTWREVISLPCERTGLAEIMSSIKAITVIDPGFNLLMAPFLSGPK